MRLNTNLRSRVDQEAALQEIRDEDYRRERIARLNRMDTDYSRFYAPRSRWSIFWEYMAFFAWLVKWTVLTAIGLVALYGVVTVVRQIVSGR